MDRAIEKALRYLLETHDREFIEALKQALVETGEEGTIYGLTHIRSFEEHGLMTQDAGLTFRIRGGYQVYVTISEQVGS